MGGEQACSGNSYNDGGVQGGHFNRWSGSHLSDHFGWKGKGYKAWRDGREKEVGSGGTKWSGGTNGTGGDGGTLPGSGTGDMHEFG